MLALAHRNGLLFGLSPFNFNGRLLSLQYVDDILLFINTNMAAMRSLKILLHNFELPSGLKIDFNKSFIY